MGRSARADAGAGNLRAAIDLANNNPGADTIVFAGAAFGGMVSLSTADAATTAATNTENLAGPSALVVRSPITIQGTGEAIIRIGGTAFRLFQVTETGDLTLQNLILFRGLAPGGAGGGGGGGAAGFGGAIYNQGTLRVFGCTLTENQAVGGSGGGGGLAGPARQSSCGGILVHA